MELLKGALMLALIFLKQKAIILIVLFLLSLKIVSHSALSIFFLPKPYLMQISLDLRDLKITVGHFLASEVLSFKEAD